MTANAMTIAEIENFAVRNGFIWGPEPEVYDSLSGLYTYGPLGTGLKRNVENIVRQAFVHAGFFEVESPLVAPKATWEGSGHLSGFVDWVVACSQCQNTYRADKLVEEKTGQTMGGDKLLDAIAEEGIVCPSCGGHFIQELQPYHLMVRADVGQRESYLRPETATMTYLSFNRYYQFFRKQFPIQVFQIGPAFRNELSPRQNIVRGRQFTQAEAQLFIKPDEDYSELLTQDRFTETVRFYPDGEDAQELSFTQAGDQTLVSKRAYLWCLFYAHYIFRQMGIANERIRLRQHEQDEMAHYALDAWDLEVYTDSLGWIECCGIHDRTDYDLKSHSATANEELKVRDNQTQEAFYPHVLEIAFGIDRPVYCLLDMYLANEETETDTRTVLRLPDSLAPVSAAIYPLVNKHGLPDVAKQLYTDLLEQGIVCMYDAGGSIGRRYRRSDEKGVPYAITIDHQTQEDNTVTVRYRDSMTQDRVPLKQVADLVRSA